jgi:hypothetical protein
MKKALAILVIITTLSACSARQLTTVVEHAGAVIDCLELIKRCVDGIKGERTPERIAAYGVQCYQEQRQSQCMETFEEFKGVK